jgi:hypothetical protein
MTTRRLAISFVIVIAALIIGGGNRAAAQEAVGDGGFESGDLPEYQGSAPESLGEWSIGALEAGGTPVIVTDPVLSGTYAAQIDTRSATRGRTIFQDVDPAAECFTWTFNVYRGEGMNWAEIVAGWRTGGEGSGQVTLLIFDDEGVEFRGWGARSRIAEPLEAGSWHEISVEADATTASQTFTIDGEVAAELQGEAAELKPETIIIGDVASNALQGLYTYDDVSLEAGTCSGASAATSSASPAEEESPALEPEDDDSGFPWWIPILLILAVLGLLILFLLLARRRHAKDEEVPPPGEGA